MSGRPMAVIAMATVLVAMAVGVAGAATLPYTENAECLECHSGSGAAVSKVNFAEDPPVVRSSACKKCHWEAAGTHPFHMATWNCGSCHPGWGVTNFSAIPKVYSPALDAYFFSAASASIDTDTLHIIHANPRWIAGVVKNGRQCGSCHSAAACTACHDSGAIDPGTHALHTWDAGLAGPWPGTEPSSMTFGSGTTPGNEYERNVNGALACSNGTCHDIASGATMPVLVEDGNASVVYAPAWGRSSTTGYTGNTYRISNGLGARADYTFTGQRIEYVTDRGPYRGMVKVYIDGTLKATVDLYAAAVEKQYVGYLSDLLSPGPHTITIEVTRTKNALSRDYFVVMDAFRVFPRVTVTRASCITCHAPDTFTGSSVDRSGDHGAPVDKHTPVSSAFCTKAGCHTTYTNIANGHGAKGDTCNTCHENSVLTDVGHLPYKFKTGVTMECQTCHNASLADLGAKTGNPFDYTNPHGGKHELNLAASNYNNTTVAGCTNAGAGCHGASQVSTDIVTYHTDKTSCYSGKCHTSGDKAGHNQPFTCASCHDGTFQYAADTVQLYDAAPAGHYSETTHTAVGMGGTVIGYAGGAVSATCANCHNPVNASGIDNLWYQHQGLPGAVNVTCSDCHNASINVTLEITGNWTNDTCADCHKVGVLPAAVQHGATASVVNGTSSLGSCASTGCHASMNLHELHKGNGVLPDPACSVCHNYSAQAARPTDKTCGTGNACHTDKTLANHGVKHTLNLTGSNYAETNADGLESGCTNAGAGCHGASQVSTNIVTYHIDQSTCTAGKCHVSVDKPNHHEPFTCASCHDGGYQYAADAVALYDLSPAGHYGDTTHTATGGLGAVTAQGGTASETCSVCHDLKLAPAHTNIATPTKGAKVTCSECHNYNANVTAEIKTNHWTSNACSDCHNATDIAGSVQHASNVLTVVTATSSTGCASTGRNCHNSSDLHYIHRNEAAGCDLAGCHDSAHKNIRPTITTCGQATGCHLNTAYTPGNHNGRTGDESTHTASAAQAADSTFYSTRCDACHFVTLKAEHDLSTTNLPGAGATSCERCHNRQASDAAIASTWLATRTGNTTGSCATCHGVTNGGDTIPARHADASSTAHTKAANSPTCGGSGAGCHPTNDYSQVGAPTTVANIHADCLTCHDKAGSATYVGNNSNMRYQTTYGLCGAATGCHPSSLYDPSTLVHNNPGYAGAGLANGDDATHHTASPFTKAYYPESGTGVYSDGKECSTCHSATLKTSHATVSTNGGVVTCTECHNHAGSANVAAGTAPAQVKSSWTNDSCVDCHLSAAAHTSFKTGAGYVANHTATQNASCAGSGNGCHGTRPESSTAVSPAGEMAQLHPNKGCNASSGASGTSCHAQNKPMAAIGKTCGSGSNCHSTYTTTAGHDAGTVTGNDSTHTVSVASMDAVADATYTYGVQCKSCHSSGMATAHTTSTVVMESGHTWTLGQSPYCTQCHNSTAPDNATLVIKTTAWAHTCDECHVTNGDGRHTQYAGTIHNSTPGSGCSLGTCHGGVTNVRAVHDRSASGCTATGSDSLGWSGGCHALQKEMPAAMPGCGAGTAGNCHINHTGSNHGVSAGGMRCYTCHSAYKETMDAAGTAKASSYHHVMGTGGYNGDIAPNAGAYPTSQTDVYCVSCHTDHNYFNADKGRNLRTDIANASGASVANSDYVASGVYGICVSCHKVIQAKQGMGTDQAALGTANTPLIAGADFAPSAHNYNVASSFGASTFNANCSKCHSDEQAKQYATSTFKFGTHWSTSVGILRGLGSFVGNPPKEEACYKCHNATAAPYGEVLSAAAKGTQAEFALASRHDLNKVECANCHNVHEASAAAPVADPDNTYNVASLATSATVNTFCLKCHDGTLPVQTVNGTTLIPYTVSANATANIAAYYITDGHGAFVDCRDCHEQHGSTLRQLLKTSVDGTNVPVYSNTVDEAQCLACHRAGGSAASANIARYYPATAYGTASAGMTRSGHRTKTAGTLPIGSALPCRMCHDPHGGAGSGYMLTVRTQLAAGVDTLTGDAPGELAMSDASQTPANADNVRRFCFSCHTTSDTSFGWNGTGMALVPAGAQVLGISRTGGFLKLPNLGTIKGHKQAETTYSCYMCHGDDFSAANSVNVHNPASGESRGGVPCYICHTVYQDRMEDGSGSSVGGNRTAGYHHVLGNGGTTEGDRITYPTLTTDTAQNVYCLSCHVDHDKFSPFVLGTYQRSANLRAQYSDAAVTSANTDFNAVGGGVCIGCHSVALTRDTTNQRSETNSTKTSVVGAAAYNTSAHQYLATSTFTDATTFNANCVKCHDSEIDGGGMEGGKSTSGFQTSTNKFSVHYSGARRLLAAWGIAITDPPAEENACYACHSVVADGFKSTANRDWYNVVAMSASSQAVHGLLAGTPASSQTSADTLYFRPTTDAMPAEPMPNAHQTGDTFQGGTWMGRSMAPNASTVAYEVDDIATTNTTGLLNWRAVTFTSPPVATGTTVAAGNWTINVWSRESATAQNSYVRYMIYKWNAADTIGTTIVAAGVEATELGTTAAPGTQRTITVAGSGVTLNAGDKVSVCLEIRTNNATGAGTSSFYFGSGAASNLVMPSAVNFTWNSPATTPTSAHLVGNYSGIHRPSPTDETAAYLSANKHVECADCHGVHAAQATRHTVGTNNVSGALAGARGTDAAIPASMWVAPTYTPVDTATKEWQICFRCHSGANTNVTTWGGTAGTAAEWTDQGLEFNPRNHAFHPVVAALNSASSGSQVLQAGDMRAAGTADGMAVGGFANGSVMYCSDCHAQGSTGSLGPHGSAVKWMLKGPNRAWPYTTAALNGTNGTANFRLLSGRAVADGNDGLFCNNCHVVGGGQEHTYNSHGVLACVACHIRVPHGGKVSRLMNATGVTTGGRGNLPARYTANGEGALSANGALYRFTVSAGGSYSRTGQCGWQTGWGGCSTDHPTTIGTENW
jgi:hypothetical protein